jgi:hypothetical protein
MRTATADAVAPFDTSPSGASAARTVVGILTAAATRAANTHLRRFTSVTVPISELRST